MAERICKNCGTLFQSDPARHRYCSKECSRLARNAQSRESYKRCGRRPSSPKKLQYDRDRAKRRRLNPGFKEYWNAYMRAWTRKKRLDPDYVERVRSYHRHFHDKRSAIKQVFAELGMHFDTAADAHRAYKELME